MMNASKITIGIITIDDYTNYGNRLQNYALTRLFEEEGFAVKNGIQVYTKENYARNTNSFFKRIIKWLMPMRYVKKKIIPVISEKQGSLKEREDRFKDFNNTYTESVGVVFSSTNKRAMDLLEKRGINYFVTGSDQVWNPYYEGRDYEFLTFAPRGKRLSFAASIGVDSIPEKQIERYKQNLSEIRFLSVREKRALEIIKELTGRDAYLTLDPTLLLDNNEWKKAVKKPDLYVPNNYICAYFLGKVPEAVQKFSKKIGLPVYTLNSEKFPELFTLDPGEFLYMIENATYVLTDSFHAVAFSIKFHREFYVFEREQEGVNSMFSRIETITKAFSLENRIQKRDEIEIQEVVSNWESIDLKLLDEKQTTFLEIKKVLRIN